ncbi:Oxidoreductase FAD/NAD(P)-binding protein [Dioscorea alata]|uniref:Oxidoreductase FAD/NAD(P)-binding protein n=2 Tax=Dioscorea alata TaxID=55571 RepID=A0ACB7UDY5_DIOAL|nr:Oxidoreductase FAD/NAD(P)-binding protein [Dioscorea alata]KAH7658560.1 Oxidoreductase FAD/NAD(P)-binding protein [Dioscorea alata]
MATLALLSTSSPPPSLLLRPMPSSLLRPLLPLRRRLSLAAAAAARPDTALWTEAPVTTIHPASADGSLFHISIDAGDLSSSHTSPGQYLQVRLPGSEKPSFLAIASPPPSLDSSPTGEFEFLVKKIAGSVAELLCGLRSGDVVELSAVMGKGFEIHRISPADAFQSVLIFATGSGISPIRSLIESGFNANERSDVRLYYGARNLQRMAYQDRFEYWESTGVKIIPVLSRPEDKWKGERGYVQAAFGRAKELVNPSSTGAVLCGHKQMAEDVTSVLVADGVSKEKILKNF